MNESSKEMTAKVVGQGPGYVDQVADSVICDTAGRNIFEAQRNREYSFRKETRRKAYIPRAQLEV